MTEESQLQEFLRILCDHFDEALLKSEYWKARDSLGILLLRSILKTKKVTTEVSWEAAKAECEGEIARLSSVISEVHAWAVCGAIASPEDMMENLPYIVKITTPKNLLEEHCTYPDCNCPADAPADPNWCLRGLSRESK